GHTALEQGYEIPPQKNDGQRVAVTSLHTETQEKKPLPLIALTFDMTTRPKVQVQVSLVGSRHHKPAQATITFLVDTGADVTTISTTDWPRDGPLDTGSVTVGGVGGKSVAHHSALRLTLRWEDGGVSRTSGPLRPYVLSIPITL
ncbi:hypothetical protein FK515_28975, partial [Klebsiella pneumoniae]|nr:hypothetical protein [Klebsiella pneumoniae]